MTDAEVVAEFQKRRTAFREKGLRPALIVTVAALVAVPLAHMTIGGWLTLWLAVAGILAVCVGTWLLSTASAGYTCPRCGTTPSMLDAWDFNPKECRGCHAQLR